MNFDRPLDEIFGSRSKVALLRLMIRTRGERTGRDLARLVSLDAKTCHTALRELGRQGVVEYRKVGPAILYRLNEGHSIVMRLIEPLFQGEGTLLQEYAEELKARLKSPVISMILFGSVARKEQRPTSDVDLVVIVPTNGAVRKAESSTDEVALDLAGRYGSAPQVVIYGQEDFRRKARSGDRFVSEVLRTGRVVQGRPLASELPTEPVRPRGLRRTTTVIDGERPSIAGREWSANSRPAPRTPRLSWRFRA